jgi:tetratricopeptide (TPR) repeat protein
VGVTEISQVLPFSFSILEIDPLSFRAMSILCLEVSMGMLSRFLGSKSTPDGETRNYKYYADKALEYHKAGKFDQALRNYSQAVELEPNTAYLWANKGVTHMKLGQYPDAIKCFDECIKHDPSFSEAWINKGASLHSLGRSVREQMDCYDRAQQSLRLQSTERDPKREEYIIYTLMRDKGQLLESLRNFAEALECYELALKAKPGDNVLLSQKGLCLVMTDHVDDGIECLKSISDGSVKVDITDQLTSVYKNGELWFTLKRPKEAKS